MQRVLQSHHLQSFDYDPLTKSLDITFVNGKVYRYRGVSELEVFNLTRTTSPGRYFHARIKGNYQGEQLESEKGKK